MKTFKFLFAIALMAFTFTASADNDPSGELQLKSKVVEGKVIIVQLFNLQQEYTKVSIESLDGKTTYFEDNIRKHNGYTRKINLENLADGRYLIQVDQDGESKNQVILVRDSTLQLSSVNG